MEVPALVCEADLHCAQTALTLVRCACLRCPAALTAEARHALTPNILALAKSPLLQGTISSKFLMDPGLDIRKYCNSPFFQLY